MIRVVGVALEVDVKINNDDDADDAADKQSVGIRCHMGHSHLPWKFNP